MDFRVRDSVSLGIAWFTACPESVPALQKSERTADSGSLSCSGEPWPDQAGVLAVKSSASGGVKRQACRGWGRFLLLGGGAGGTLGASR